MNQKHLLHAIQQTAQNDDFGVRLPGAERLPAPLAGCASEKLCSSVWLSDCSIPSSSDVMALRMALPKMGNSASASMRGLDCTESCSASSSSGWSARRSLTSGCGRRNRTARPARRRRLRRGATDCPDAAAAIPRPHDPGQGESRAVRPAARRSASAVVLGRRWASDRTPLSRRRLP